MLVLYFAVHSRHPKSLMIFGAETTCHTTREGCRRKSRLLEEIHCQFLGTAIGYYRYIKGIFVRSSGRKLLVPPRFLLCWDSAPPRYWVPTTFWPAAPQTRAADSSHLMWADSMSATPQFHFFCIFFVNALLYLALHSVHPSGASRFSSRVHLRTTGSHCATPAKVIVDENASGNCRSGAGGTVALPYSLSARN